ncbi:helix-turn-helix transcriptional regulator [Brevibacillus laterosporus]|uniref:Helix-turn-helix transcriptional regulator n=1 Tax=Brevibacillus laterosporus TaxID=1465 RepID=A0AAP3DME6_BRELA|nr:MULTISPECIES: helix-turn-helix transcriptional regulator [Bacillales]MCR8937643.1 helix-turn-helix domain-containing protein [Brevibacillus laterosporus]MCR8982909.1 helix-turn-helix domain-containing protein [Brevibacillus laterosporus]MCR8997832.1 helix-turn-helix domain-containing protein [Brevibacillus laterosporus]MCZ0810065.1 helix-turn-helix transcriptional regulator [Brevibacillus laterosporus]MCZ0828671.1 helix-turn-helix transcriptional regulator [Brevibacillus laterosporus]
MDAVTLRAIRVHFGLTQQQFAKRLGMSKSAISAVETGKREITGSLRVKIARAFEIDDSLIDTIHKAKVAEQLVF